MSTLARGRTAASNSGSHLEASPYPQRSEKNEAKWVWVYNRSGQSFLSLEVAVFDTPVKPLKTLLESFVVRDKTGLWLTPLREIPFPLGLPSFDVVHLDQESRVIQGVESYPGCDGKAPQGQAKSVLLLPPNTPFASQIKPGDQIAACSSKEMQRLLTQLSNPVAPDPIAQHTKSSAEPRPIENDSAPILSDEPVRQMQVAVQQLESREAKSYAPKKDSLKDRFLLWLYPERSDRRAAGRHPLPGLIAYHQIGGTPQANRLGNISKNGFYLLTDERPYLGTMILMTLQKSDANGENIGDSISVFTKVIRQGSDGVGLAFVTARSTTTKGGEQPAKHVADRETLEEFLEGLNLLESR